MIWAFLTFQEFFLFIVIAYGSLFLHEVGHAIVALMNQSQKVTIHIGKGSKLFTLRFGRLEIKVRKLFLINFYNAAYRARAYSRKEKILMTICGPLSNGILAFVFWVLYLQSWFDPLLFVSFLFNLWLFVFNLIPFKIGQSTSDGYTIYKLMRMPNDQQ